MKPTLALVPTTDMAEANDIAAGTPSVLRSWWGGGIAASSRSDDAIRVLVAAPSAQSDYATREAIIATFGRQSRRGAPLTVIAAALDDVVTQLGAKSVCATLLEADGHGFTVLHRGNPAPLLVGGDGEARALQPRVPGPPLGLGGGTVEVLPASRGDIVVLSTPAFAGQLSETLLGVPAQPDSMWHALTTQALVDPYPGALAMVVGENAPATGVVRMPEDFSDQRPVVTQRKGA
ncbi:MAG TPA: hypothetical protein VMW94_03360 [Actinomycetes bacterium]|nr:hypothetical protein [Actinomycetes bacterium]